MWCTPCTLPKQKLSFTFDQTPPQLVLPSPALPSTNMLPIEYFTSVTTFIFLEGKHYLNSPLWIDNKSNISMKGINTNVTIIMTPNARLGLWNCETFALSSFKVQYYGCVQDISEDDACSALMVYSSRDIEFNGVEFSRFLGTEATFSKAVILQESTAHITDLSQFNSSMPHTLCGGVFCIVQSTAIFS